MKLTSSSRILLQTTQSVLKNVEMRIAIRKEFRRFLLLGISIFIVLSTKAETYYVSSSTGDDSNPGTSLEFPWKTLDKVNSQSFSPGDQVLFKRGDRWAGTILVRNSGTSGSSVLYGSYGSGSSPVLVGTKEVSDWSLHTGNIYRSLKGKTEPSQLFEDGKRLQISRLPATGYYQVDNVSGSNVFSISELGGKAANYWAGATVIMRNADWSFEARKIVSSSGDYITLESAPKYNVASGNNVFIVNHVDGITKAGQWAYSEVTGYFYIRTIAGDTPSNHSINESGYDYGFSGSGINYVTIQGFDIRGFRKDAVNFSGICSNIKIDSNTIADNYECGVQAYGSTSSTGITISNNTITGSNRDGIRVQARSFTISDNTIENISLVENIGISAFIDHYNTACGILASSGQSSKISYNKIKNIGYNGITFSGYNTIEYNTIDRVCLTLQDGGGIYTHTNSSGSLIRNNIVSNNGPSYSTSSNGIYLDDGTVGVSVESNTCFGNNGNGLFLHNVANVSALKNTLYNNKKQFYVRADNLNNLAMSNNVASDNIFYSPFKEQASLDFSDAVGKGLGVKTDHNFYGNPVNPSNIVVNYNTILLSKFQEYPDWGVGAKELPGLLNLYEIADTLSSNLVSNGDFARDNSNWYGGEWVTGVLDGGSHKRVATGSASAIQHYNFNIPVSGEKQFLVTMDVAAANSSNSGRVMVGTTEIGRVLMDKNKRSSGYVFSTSASITSRLTVDVWGEAGDVYYLDNVKMYEVKANIIDPLEKSKLYYNDTKSIKYVTLREAYTDLNGNAVTGTILLQPFSSKILIKEIRNDMHVR